MTGKLYIFRNKLVSDVIINTKATSKTKPQPDSKPTNKIIDQFFYEDGY